ncbi:hypothetical protein [uncultured Roseivirga sp.]|uniref:VPS10 domain-containing protein n=1 Tax=uncultured Roseivirga sp. TaxID=543088 RepID=UPI0030DC1D53|tara:strand:+ start:849 stop:3947 length:3099 start_codon:yes stop_codon:yes gene_type:complete
MNKKILLTLMVFIGLLGSVSAQKIDMSLLEDMKPRSIGPAGASGRITAFDVELNNPDIIYAGTAAGGLWVSENGGSTWDVLFDDGKSASIGSIAINQNNPNEIWVGTGEGNPRNSMNNGAGIYKTIDKGRTWKFLGLEKTNGIHRIILNPNDPKIAVVAATGTPWGENPERGIYKTTDGGKTWTKTLYIDVKTGAADLVVDPSNPNKLIAAMWEHRRWPWFFNSGGSGSGIFVSLDGGDTWNRRTAEEGLPKGDLGRIGLAFAPSDPNRVYAYVESKSNAIFRSDDGGFNWQQVSKDGDRNIGGRPFYYADIYVDPINENRIYSIHSTVTVSEDGGKTWSSFVSGGRVHTDHHAWWIHPEDPSYILDGHDGGLTYTRDRGKNWHFVESLPLTQFYHVRVDNDIPYNIYGGAQDNGSWRGPSQSWFRGGIRNFYWQRLSTGDGFDMAPDPRDNRYGWSMGQGGNLNYYDRVTGLMNKVRPVHPEGVALRFNWNAALEVDKIDESVAYYGSQFLHKTNDRGASWEIISPDLTTNDPAKQDYKSGGLTYDNTDAENHTTITAIGPSPKQAGVIWVGTDDGNVQVTQDGGKTWNNVVSNMKGLPANAWITQVQPSEYDAAEAFVVIDNHRMHDWMPYVYHTKNFGRTWTRLVDDSDMRGATLSFVQDPIEPKLMFTGTEFGLWVSIDAGATWSQWTNGYGTLPTQDMVIHPREHDLVIATFGRSFWVLDDIRPLRAMAAMGMKNLLDKQVQAFDAPDAYKAFIGESFGYRANLVGDAIFEGDNRSPNAMISFYFKGKDDKTERVKVEILDDKGVVVKTINQNAKNGLNRLEWRLDSDGADPSAGRFSRGPDVFPGKYTIRVSYKNEQSEAKVNVFADPRMEVNMQDMVAKRAFMEKYNQLQSKVNSMTTDLRNAKAAVEKVNARVKEEGKSVADPVVKRGQEMIKAIDELYYQINSKPAPQGSYSDGTVLSAKLGLVRGAMQSVQLPITKNDETAMKLIEAAVPPMEAKVKALLANDFAAYKSYVNGLGLKLISDK